MVTFDGFKFSAHNYMRYPFKYYPKSSGTYMIVVLNKKKELIEIKYIGTCQSFRIRMVRHLTVLEVKNSLSKEQKMSIWFLKHGTNGRRQIESWFIKKYKPVLNKTNPVIATSRIIVNRLIRQSYE